MKFYRVELFEKAGESSGFDFYTDLRKATACDVEWRKQNGGTSRATVTQIDIEPTRKGILEALNRYASHADNG